MPKPKSPFPDPAYCLPDEYGMLAAVLASPLDDLPKLVYADWLEERDDPRGPFLRKWVQARQTGQPRPTPPKGLFRCWLSVIGYTLDAQLADLGNPAWADAIRQTAEPGVLVNTKPHKGKPLPTGASKVGGLPDLHPDTEWPEGENGPAAFVAQWNLAELAASPVCRELPRTGLLSFFIDLVPFVEGNEAGEMKVVYTPSLDELVEREPDEERHEENVLRECRAEFREWLALPHPHSPCLEPFRLSRKVLDHYRDFYFNYESGAGSPHILGHPTPIQTDPAPSGETGWLLLTEFNTDQNAGLEACDGGTWYFMVREKQLKKAQFGDVYTAFQTG